VQTYLGSPFPDLRSHFHSVIQNGGAMLTVSVCDVAHVERLNRDLRRAGRRHRRDTAGLVLF
jgi:hypothetical protein